MRLRFFIFYPGKTHKKQGFFRDFSFPSFVEKLLVFLRKI